MFAMAWLCRLSDRTLLIIASMWLLIGEALRLCCINPLDAERSLEGLLLCGHSIALRHA
jgi:hypothetical protein